MLKKILYSFLLVGSLASVGHSFTSTFAITNATSTMQPGNPTIFVASGTIPSLNTTTLKFNDGTTLTSSSQTIHNSSSLQSGAVFNVSSGTVNGLSIPFTVGASSTITGGNSYTGSLSYGLSASHILPGDIVYANLKATLPPPSFLSAFVISASSNTDTLSLDSPYMELSPFNQSIYLAAGGGFFDVTPGEIDILPGGTGQLSVLNSSAFATPTFYAEADINNDDLTELVVKGASGQTQDFQQWENSSGTPLTAMSPTGKFDKYNGDTTQGNGVSSVVVYVSSVGATGNIAVSTPIASAANPGIYKINEYLTITSGTVSGTINDKFSWKDSSGITRTNTNASTTADSNSVWLGSFVIQTSGGPITYSLSPTVGTPPLIYNYYLVIERLN